MSLSVEQYDAYSLSICRQLLDLLIAKDFQVVHCFWPNTANREPDLVPFIRETIKLSRQIVLPVITSYESPGVAHNRISHREYTVETPLIPNKWGILEPVSGSDFPIGEIDLMLVPALAVDMQGYRIGYGGGYYDEILKRYSGPTVCPIFESCLFEKLPREEHDFPVQQILTEESLFNARDTT